MKNQNGKAIVIVILLLAVIAAAIVLAYKINKTGEDKAVVGEGKKVTQEPVEVKKLKIVDEDSKSRPYAVMINNNHDAWPQCGLQDAYLVYEIISEGGITRMMALFKDKDTAKIGSIRSSRHYFIDYAEENDAMYVHWGASPQAYKRLSSIDSMDGIALENIVFFRDKTLDRDYEHTGFTSMANVKKYAEEQGYTRDTDKDLLLNYSVDEIDMSKIEGAKPATSIDLKYSYYHTTSYEYDEENKVYKRSMSNKPNVDLVTGEQYTAKNIIIYEVENYTLNDGSGKGRQELENIGSGTGYLVSDGYSVPITWEKTTHSGQTVYKYMNGEEIKVNDGSTYIQICPTSGKITIEGPTVEEPTVDEPAE